MGSGWRASLIALAAMAVLGAGCGERAAIPVPPLPSLSGQATPGPAGLPPGLLPAPDQPIPTDPEALASALSDTTAALTAAVDRWLADGHTDRPGIPSAVVHLGLFQQRIYRFLSSERGLWKEVRARLSPDLAREGSSIVAASSRLRSLVTPITGDSTFRTAPPPPAGLLLRFFKEGERRFGVEWEVLAAVCYVESKFARVHSASSAGAQGPMQFIPTTWATYGMGGDVHDPHDAILGAANYLHASGAPGDDRSALFAYNRSTAYVDAILHYADVMRADPRRYYALYSWQVFVVTTKGDRRLTGPGL